MFLPQRQVCYQAQYIYQDSKLLVPIVCLKPVYVSLGQSNLIPAHTTHQPGRNSMQVNFLKGIVTWVISACCVIKKPKTVLLTTVLKTVAFIAGKKIQQPKSFLLVFFHLKFDCKHQLLLVMSPSRAGSSQGSS